jgi:hypothetical protein
MMMPRYGHACTGFKDEIIISGGRNQQAILDAVESLNTK